jgi:ubiquinone/menaquinone biosynthesis C-methylase UbiE
MKTGLRNDQPFGYPEFRESSGYEHESEVMALRRLLDKLLTGSRFRTAVDVGGGYGRLSAVLAEYADQVTLVDPSSQQLGLAKRAYPGGPPFRRRRADAAHLGFADGSIDLVALVRVLRHLPDPQPEIAELSRILRPGGYAIVEVTKSHHDPDVIARQLASVGLHPREVLSVSNLRHPLAKAVLPQAVLPQAAMLAVERAAQRPLGSLQFGPSVFFLMRKAGLSRGVEDGSPPLGQAGIPVPRQRSTD